MDYVKEAPIFYPTTEEFLRPMEYIESIRSKAESAGICKIVPPRTWRTPFAIEKEKFRFQTRVQTVTKVDGIARIERSFNFLVRKHLFMKGVPQGCLGESLPLVPTEDNTIPTTPVRLYRLFIAVQDLGGPTEVIGKNLWLKVAQNMFPWIKSHSKKNVDEKNFYNINDPSKEQIILKPVNIYDLAKSLRHCYERNLLSFALSQNEELESTKKSDIKTPSFDMDISELMKLSIEGKSAGIHGAILGKLGSKSGIKAVEKARQQVEAAGELFHERVDIVNVVFNEDQTEGKIVDNYNEENEIKNPQPLKRLRSNTSRYSNKSHNNSNHFSENLKKKRYSTNLNCETIHVKHRRLAGQFGKRELPTVYPGCTFFRYFRDLGKSLKGYVLNKKLDVEYFTNNGDSHHKEFNTDYNTLQMLVASGETKELAKEALLEGICQTCFRADNASNLLLCDNCNFAYHLECLDIPLREIPSGDWFCSFCLSSDIEENDGDDNENDNENEIERIKNEEKMEIEDDKTKLTNALKFKKNLAEFGFDQGDEFTFEDYKAAATNFKQKYFDKAKLGNNQNIFKASTSKGRESEIAIEREYWRFISDASRNDPELVDLTVMYGSDIDTEAYGSGFPSLKLTNELKKKAAKLANKLALSKDGSSLNKKGSSLKRKFLSKDHGNNSSMYAELLEIREKIDEYERYAKDGWNLTVFPKLDGSLLKFVDDDITGVIVPWLYMGMFFSSFCWHVEDQNFASINYHHWGAPKQWYGVPASGAEAFENAAKKLTPELFDARRDILTGIVTQYNPTEMCKLGVPVRSIIQRQGEFVVTFPQAYHGGFNHGLNCAEAVNFATLNWLPFGEKCITRYIDFKKTPVFSYQGLLAKLLLKAIKKKTHQSKKNRVNDNNYVDTENNIAENNNASNHEIDSHNNDNNETNFNNDFDEDEIGKIHSKSDKYINNLILAILPRLLKLSEEHLFLKNKAIRYIKDLIIISKNEIVKKQCSWLNFPSVENMTKENISVSPEQNLVSLPDKKEVDILEKEDISKNSINIEANNQYVNKKNLQVTKTENLIHGKSNKMKNSRNPKDIMMRSRNFVSQEVCCEECSNYCYFSYISMQRKVNNMQNDDNNYIEEKYCIDHALEKYNNVIYSNPVLVLIWDQSIFSEVFEKVYSIFFNLNHWRDFVYLAYTSNVCDDGDDDEKCLFSKENMLKKSVKKVEYSDMIVANLKMLCENEGYGKRETSSFYIAPGVFHTLSNQADGNKLPYYYNKSFTEYNKANKESDSSIDSSNMDDSVDNNKEEDELIDHEERLIKSIRILKDLIDVAPSFDISDDNLEYKELTNIYQNVKKLMDIREKRNFILKEKWPKLAILKTTLKNTKSCLGKIPLWKDLNEVLKQALEWKRRLQGAKTEEDVLSLNQELEEKICLNVGPLQEVLESKLVGIKWMNKVENLIQNGYSRHRSIKNISPIRMAQQLLDEYLPSFEYPDIYKSLRSELSRTKRWMTFAKEQINNTKANANQLYKAKQDIKKLKISPANNFLLLVNTAFEEVEIWESNAQKLFEDMQFPSKLPKESTVRKVIAESKKIGVSDLEITKNLEIALQKVDKWRDKTEELFCSFQKLQKLQTITNVEHVNRKRVLYTLLKRSLLNLDSSLIIDHPDNFVSSNKNCCNKIIVNDCNGKSKPQYDNNGNQLYCVCRMPNLKNEFMFACDSCDEWYHPACLATTREQVEEVGTFHCPTCVYDGKGFKKPTNNLNKNLASEPVYCYCRRPHDPNAFMIGCETCEDWFHPLCVGISSFEAQNIDKYHCPDCCIKQGRKPQIQLYCICRKPEFGTSNFNESMISCEKCEEWFHPVCIKMDNESVDLLLKSKSAYFCSNCCTKGDVPYNSKSGRSGYIATNQIYNQELAAKSQNIQVIVENSCNDENDKSIEIATLDINCTKEQIENCLYKLSRLSVRLDEEKLLNQILQAINYWSKKIIVEDEIINSVTSKHGIINKSTRDLWKSLFIAYSIPVKLNETTLVSIQVELWMRFLVNKFFSKNQFEKYPIIEDNKKQQKLQSGVLLPSIIHKKIENKTFRHIASLIYKNRNSLTTTRKDIITEIFRRFSL